VYTISPEPGSLFAYIGAVSKIRPTDYMRPLETFWARDDLDYSDNSPILALKWAKEANSMEQWNYSTCVRHWLLVTSHL